MGANEYTITAATIVALLVAAIGALVRNTVHPVGPCKEERERERKFCDDRFNDMRQQRDDVLEILRTVVPATESAVELARLRSKK
jgi:hypothetical protein